MARGDAVHGEDYKQTGRWFTVTFKLYQYAHANKSKPWTWKVWSHPSSERTIDTLGQLTRFSCNNYNLTQPHDQICSINNSAMIWKMFCEETSRLPRIDNENCGPSMVARLGSLIVITGQHWLPYRLGSEYGWGSWPYNYSGAECQLMGRC